MGKILLVSLSILCLAGCDYTSEKISKIELRMAPIDCKSIFS
jgi:hypothetical protein